MQQSSRTPRRNPCDQCHRRKVRCDYETPCKRCHDSDIACTHTLVRKKRGPKSGRGAVIERLRTGTTPQGSPTSITSSPINHRTNVPHSEPFGSPAQQYVGQTLPSSGHQQPLEAHGHHSYDTGPLDASFITFDEFTQHVLADDFSLYGVGQPQDMPVTGPSTGTSNGAAMTPLEASVYSLPNSSLQTPNITEDLESTALIQRSVELFFSHLYPIYPLVDQARIQGLVRDFHSISKTDRGLLWSMAALTLVHVDNWPSLGNEQRCVAARRFIKRCLEVRVKWNIEQATFEDVLTSLFVGITYFELKCRTTSWFYVREAIGLLTAAGITNPATYTNLNEEDAVRYKRGYAILFISERGASLHDNFPVSVLAPPELPYAVLPGEDPTIAVGLSALHSLFALLDMKFVRIWNDPAAFSETCYVDLLALQAHLRDLEIPLTGVSDIQKADVLITHQWLRLIFWQAALRQGFISTTASDPAFTYNFPAEVAVALCEVVKSVPPVAIQVHGLGIFEKEFEVAYSLMDTLAFSTETLPEHHECLRYLLLSLSASPNSRQIFVKTLEKAIGDQQQQKYRSLAGVQLLRDDTNSRQNSRRQSNAFHPS